MTNYAINTLRICVKSRNYVFGDSLLLDIRQQKVYLVIIASDAGKAANKKIIDKCNSFNVKYCVCFDKLTLSDVFGKNLSSVGIKDKNLADKFLENISK